jgi:S1-C subfamily serine protease
MLLFLFSCVMPMLDTSHNALFNDDSFEETSLSVGKVDRSIRSSVKLIIKDGETRGHASGNYFKHGRHKFIITAAHVVSSGEIWIEDGLEILKAETVWVDNDRDIAIIKPMGELFKTKPVKLRINSDRSKVGTIVRYAGYPSELGKMVLGGMVSQQNNHRVIVQSFALPGSSGSVIFDEKGRAVAVLSAVAVEMNPWVGIPEIEENIVYAGRLDFITRRFLKEVLNSA